ncbi:MAG: hypothetical protein JWM47_4498 [Acidimicrobiales bacterium]|nr:hypothetical protein [Acidimicrobiales bacterium]
MQTTYQHWAARAQRQFAEMRAKGQPIDKVLITPESFVQWARGQPAFDVSSRSRARYAVFVVRNIEREGGPSARET